ncbi:MAG: sodium-dependent transporter [Clostridia bacterium]|nr:sodium-dependent transporter [Clostridia bacterium]
MEKKRNGFASGFGFIMAAAGSAVGLGNLWGFPYKTHEYGGAAFVLVYIACVILIGVITMTCEIFIGRRAQANPITAFKMVDKKIGWFGVLAILIPGFIACYYSVLGGYTVRFTVNSFKGNTGTFGAFASNGVLVTIFTAIFIAMAVFVVMAGVKGGIEKASKILMPTLFVLLLATAIFSLCLGEGVAEGLKFYLKPDFSKLSGTEILAAMGQAFYSLSLGMGAMIVYGSYTGKEVNLVKSTATICVFDTLVALLAGFAIFPALYHYKATMGVMPENIQGSKLMYETLPMVFESLGVVGKVVSFCFFAMVVIAAVTSVMSLFEVVCQFVIQKFRVSRKKAISTLALICFAISIPVGISAGQDMSAEGAIKVFGMDLLSFFDTVTNTVLMPVCAFFACVAVGWLLGPKKVCKEMEEDGQKLGFFKPIFSFMVKFVTPILIFVIEIFGVYALVFPSGKFSSNGLGIALFSYGLLAVGTAIYFIFFKNKDTGCNADEE